MIFKGEYDKQAAYAAVREFAFYYPNQREMDVVIYGAIPEGVDHSRPYFVATTDYTQLKKFCYHAMLPTNWNRECYLINTADKVKTLSDVTLILAPGYEKLPLEFFEALSSSMRGNLQVELAAGYQPLTVPDRNFQMYFYSLNHPMMHHKYESPKGFQPNAPFVTRPATGDMV